MPLWFCQSVLIASSPSSKALIGSNQQKPFPGLSVLSLPDLAPLKQEVAQTTLPMWDEILT